MTVCNSVPETKLVTRSEPFHRTIEPLIKLAPETVSVKEGPPAVAKEGLRPVTMDAGILPLGWSSRVTTQGSL
jgi:hypothetical protein